MDKLTKQFFGDAKRMHLSSREKAQLWQGISTFASAKQMNLSSLEKADGFDAIARHMKKNPVAQPISSSLFTWMHFHKLTASLLIALIIVGTGGGGVAYASQAAVPGDALYTVKVDITEPLIDVALSFDPERRAEWERRRLKRRLKEAEHLSASHTFTSDRRARLQERIEHRMERMQKNLDLVPEDRREMIQNKVDDVMQKHQQFLDHFEEDAIRPEELRAFKKHMGGVRHRAHKNWARDTSIQKAPPAGRLPVEGWLSGRPPSSVATDYGRVNSSAAHGIHLFVEGWLSGRKRSPRKRVDPQGSHGFESLTLRQTLQ